MNRGFGKDLTKNHSLNLHVDYLNIVGDYEVNGKILILPVVGSGKSNITTGIIVGFFVYHSHEKISLFYYIFISVDVNMFLNFVGVPLEKDGATFMHIEKLNVAAQPKKMIFKVDNLFNGDKALSDNINLFLNENWQEIYTELYDPLNKAYSIVFKDIINSVFSKYPYDKYFTE